MRWNFTGIDWKNASSFEVIDYVSISYQWDNGFHAYGMPDERVNVVRDSETKIPEIWE